MRFAFQRSGRLGWRRGAGVERWRWPALWPAREGVQDWSASCCKTGAEQTSRRRWRARADGRGPGGGVMNQRELKRQAEPAATRFNRGHAEFGSGSR